LDRAGPARELTNTIGMKLVLIPAGEFLMGSPGLVRAAYSNQTLQHRVRITRPFYLGVHEVTQGQYRSVTGQSPSKFKGSDDLPVEQVSWNDAVAFCNRLSEQERLAPYYKVAGTEAILRGEDEVTILGGEGYRLPTEAEWEYACRAGSTSRYCYGDDAASLGDYAWYFGNSDGGTSPVGQKRPNAFGLYDMHGNVFEWCWDKYDEGYYGRSPDADPAGPSQSRGFVRVIRGGSWSNDANFVLSAYRDGTTPFNQHFKYGFRVARVPSVSK
jgi:formylglycine-generating enzyme required for sulfatase activity